MRREIALLLMALAALPATADPRYQTVDVPMHIYSGGWEHYVGGGLAAFDCNGDGLPELFAAGGSAPATLLVNRSPPGGTIRFLAETPQSLRLNSVTGAYPLDIDSDGTLDLVILRAGENLLMKGGSDCAFSPFQSLGFVSADRWTTAFSATWEAGRSLPTLAFGNYVDRSDPDGPFRACDVAMLYRPDGSAYAAPLALSPGHCPLSMLFSDWGRTGRADLRISNDRHYYVDDGEEQMWAMEDLPRLYDAADGWKAHKLWGMGIASRDLTGDGLPEVFLTSMGDQRLQLPAGNGRPEYTDAPYALGTTAHRPYMGDDGRPSTGWHVAFGDVQNDGCDDIFITKGNVEQMPDSAMEDPNNLLIQNAERTFTEMGAESGVASLHRGRGAAMVDLNADGLLDIAVVNRRAPLEVWQNITPEPGNAISVSVRQPAPNVNAVGAWIEVRADGVIQSREITVGGGHAGGSAGPEHFGLGPAEMAELRVIWPDGTMSPWVERPANVYATHAER
ncbi:CRTAC1 family protein [Sedimentitalea todarodis]|uniref:CRTAC1 family protein n=1 Tax=Sedimentitalea todarodis TaxID=1631240 RepID=A0ABU3VFW5_9RHOB|nr:CRTAC1 family protein [Sedimentitalea todarodis]MDU9005077.1 CRTAC1 family protein [Sedimentitalea todarodis]